MKILRATALPTAVLSCVWAMFVCIGALVGEPLNTMAFKKPEERKVARLKMCTELVRWDYLVPSVPLYCWLTEPVK